MHDTIIDEVRKFRDEYARQFNYDLHAMCLDLRREQELGGAPIVSFSTKPIQQNLAPQSAQADTNKSRIAAPDSPVSGQGGETGGFM